MNIKKYLEKKWIPYSQEINDFLKNDKKLKKINLLEKVNFICKFIIFVWIISGCILNFTYNKIPAEFLDFTKFFVLWFVCLMLLSTIILIFATNKNNKLEINYSTKLYNILNKEKLELVEERNYIKLIKEDFIITWVEREINNNKKTYRKFLWQIIFKKDVKINWAYTIEEKEFLNAELIISLCGFFSLWIIVPIAMSAANSPELTKIVFIVSVPYLIIDTIFFIKWIRKYFDLKNKIDLDKGFYGEKEISEIEKIARKFSEYTKSEIEINPTTNIINIDKIMEQWFWENIYKRIIDLYIFIKEIETLAEAIKDN